MTDTIDRSGSDEAEVLNRLVVRFAGDSGDGMQLTGDRFTSVSAAFGNDLSTFPDFPAEIRAPQGTVNGVSAFQVQISDHDITTPGDEPNVLVAMNPAALMADLHRLEIGGTLIVNEDSFDERNLEKAGYDTNPLDDGTVADYRVLQVPMTSLTKEACTELGVKPRDAERSKNFFALGLVSWMYTRPIQPDVGVDRAASSRRTSSSSLRTRRRSRPGSHSARPPRRSATGTRSARRQMPPGEYTSISGNTALAWGLIAAGQLAKLPVTLGSYPITPASDILHELSKHKHFGVRTVQAEDEIAAVGVALGAAFSGHLGVTTTSRPGRGAQERDDLARHRDRAAAADHRHPARWPLDRASRRRRRPPISTWRCTAATASRRSRSWRATARLSASSPRSRRPASRSSTAPR